MCISRNYYSFCAIKKVEMVASGLVDRIRAEDCPQNPLHNIRKSIEDLVEYK